MHRRLFLKCAITLFALIGIAIIVIAFLSSLAPSKSAKNNAEFVFSIPNLEPGKLIVLPINERILFILQPNQQQLKSIAQLDAYVWNTAKDAYVAELNAYVYWGLSTRWGCILQEKPAAASRLTWNSDKAQWLGGYWDPICEVSYDYAGRTIRSSSFTYNGYSGKLPNLIKPPLKLSGNTLTVSLL